MLAGAPKKPKKYFRFIDDIFLIFEGNELELNTFLEYCNEYHPTIKFTAEYSKEKVSFLDTWVKINPEGQIYTDLYTKKTDTQNYLYYTSCHPKHCNEGGPLGEFLRLRRNCTNFTDFIAHAKKRKRDYLERGYPENILNNALEKAILTERESLLQKNGNKNKKRLERVPLVIDYNPANPNFNKIIEKHWSLLDLSKKCKDTFALKPIISYRRPKNLGDNLVRAALPTDPKNTNTAPTTLGRCKNANPFCIYCPRKNMSPQYTSSYTNRSYTGPTNYKCGVRNVVYLITCRKCNIQYVGQAYRTYREWISEHLGYIRRKKVDQATGKHFNLPGHTIHDMNHRVIAHLKGEYIRNNPKLIELEERLIERLRTMEPHGLNDRNSLRV